MEENERTETGIQIPMVSLWISQGCEAMKIKHVISLQLK